MWQVICRQHQGYRVHRRYEWWRQVTGYWIFFISNIIWYWHYGQTGEGCHFWFDNKIIALGISTPSACEVTLSPPPSSVSRCWPPPLPGWITKGCRCCRSSCCRDSWPRPPRTPGRTGAPSLEAPRCLLCRPSCPGLHWWRSSETVCNSQKRLEGNLLTGKKTAIVYKPVVLTR